VPEIKHGGVGLAHQEVAVALNRGDVAQAAATLSFAVAATISKAGALGLQQGLVEGREVQPFAAILFGAEVAGRSD